MLLFCETDMDGSDCSGVEVTSDISGLRKAVLISKG